MKSFKEYTVLKENLAGYDKLRSFYDKDGRSVQNPQTPQTPQTLPFPEIFDEVAQEMNQAIQKVMQQALKKTAVIVQANMVGHEIPKEDLKGFILNTNWNHFKALISQTPGGYFSK